MFKKASAFILLSGSSASNKNLCQIKSQVGKLEQRADFLNFFYRDFLMSEVNLIIYLNEQIEYVKILTLML